MEYHIILLTAVPKNSYKIHSIIKRYKIEENPDVRNFSFERVPDVLLAPSKNYTGLLVIDGNARTVASGRIKRGIEAYVCNSDDDRDEINRLMSEMKLVTGSSSLRKFLMEVYSFDELVLKGESTYEKLGKLSLRKYLRRNK